MDKKLTLVAALVFGILCAPLLTDAQERRSEKMARIGVLSPLSAEGAAPLVEAFRKGLSDLGWVEGRNFTIETRFAAGKVDRLPELAAQLVQRRVDMILAGSNPGILAAKNASAAIPIVMVTTGDPVAGALVASLARPGGNITGVTAAGPELIGKQLELLTEVVPRVTRVSVLVNPTSPFTGRFLEEKDRIARALGWRLQVLAAQDPSEFEKVFAAMGSERAGAFMVLMDIMFTTHRRRIVELAAKSRLPAIYGERGFVDAGGLMSYGAGLAGMYRQAAIYANKVLKGAKPADLPVEQPTTFELAINLKTANALGLTIPKSVLLRADYIVQ